jgi:hypothetical protein
LAVEICHVVRNRGDLFGEIPHQAREVFIEPIVPATLLIDNL